MVRPIWWIKYCNYYNINISKQDVKDYTMVIYYKQYEHIVWHDNGLNYDSPASMVSTGVYSPLLWPDSKSLIWLQKINSS